MTQIEHLEEVAGVSITLLTDGSMRLHATGIEDNQEGQDLIRELLMRAFYLMTQRPEGVGIQ